MSDITIKHISEFEYYEGEHAEPGIKFIYAGKGLGVTAWGMNILQMDPNVDTYPEHDHAADGQEEVYVILEGGATLISGEEKRELKQGALVRVGPNQKRKFIPGEYGAVILAIGGTPGKAYTDLK